MWYNPALLIALFAAQGGIYWFLLSTERRLTRIETQLDFLAEQIELGRCNGYNNENEKNGG